MTETITITKEDEDLDAAIKKLLEQSIVVYNDDVNTFDHVIHCLMIYCNHAPDQAEQCALIVHYKGKCSVKSGSFEDLKPICEALLQKGITAKIE
jgi:ATP-dependent Clp protease adaptor protein ClpS